MLFSLMISVMHENPTRKKIIYLLKKNGPLSIESLSSELLITSMGIRQHLLSLERKGYITYVAKRKGIGRPAFLYQLTEKAQNLFPTAYDIFLVETFKDIEGNEGSGKIEELFKWHKNRFLNLFKEALSTKKTLRDRLSGISDILNARGYLAEIADSDDHFSLVIFNCPIYRLSREFREACRFDLQMFQELIGQEVSREKCMNDGDISCSYRIPKNISG